MSEKKSSRPDSPDTGHAPPTGDRATSPLSDLERRAFAALPRDLPPPPGLEERLIDALRREGRIAEEGASRRGWIPWAASLLALGLGLGAGWLLWGTPAGLEPPAAPVPAEADAEEYLLALYEAPGRSTDEAEHRRLAAEYGAWARRRAEAGELLAGEPLAPRGWLLPGAGASPRPSTEPSPGHSELVGYFLIRAPDTTRALEIAGDCPHLRHGGSVLVRPIRD